MDKNEKQVLSRRLISVKIIEVDDEPDGFCAATVKDANSDEDKYLIILNGNETEKNKTAAFVHEMLHIWHRDFSKKDVDVNLLEAIRHAECAELGFEHEK